MMDARLHGQADYRNGKRLEHNPYRSIKQGKRAWIKGWHEAREKADGSRLSVNARSTLIGAER